MKARRAYCVLMTVLLAMASLPLRGQVFDSVFHHPYCFNFDDVDIVGDDAASPLLWGWTDAYISSNYTTPNVVGVSGRSGSNSLYYPATAEMKKTMIVLPEFDFDSTDAPVLGFWCWNRALWSQIHGEDTSEIVFGYVETSYDGVHRYVQPTTFIEVRRLRVPGGFTWQHVQAEFPSGLPLHSRLAIRYVNHVPPYVGRGSILYIDDVTVTTCGAGELRDVTLPNLGREDFMDVDWREAGNPTVRVTLQRDDESPIPLDASTHPLSINGLSPYHRYTVRMTAWCGDSTECTAYRDSLMIYGDSLDADACVPTTALLRNNHSGWNEDGLYFALLRSGSVSSMPGNYPHYPHNSNGVFETGTYDRYDFNRAATQHARHVVPGERDPMTQFRLRTIPDGHSHSRRVGGREPLGDWVDGDFYPLTIDTNDYDLLIVRYAAVQSALVDATPARLDIGLLHGRSDNDPLGEPCAGHSAISWHNEFGDQGWQRCGITDGQYYYERDSLRWRDWMPRMFDLSSYHGEKLTLNIAARNGSATTFSGATYFFAPISYAYYVIECARRYTLLRECTSTDSLLLQAPKGFGYRWYSGDVSLGTADSLRVPNDTGLYYCRLVHLELDSCPIVLTFRVLPIQSVPAVFRDTVLENDLPYIYRGITFDGAADTVLLVSVTDGCDTALHFTLHVWPNQSTRQERSVCPGDFPLTWMGQMFIGPDSVTLMLTDVHGADSMVTLVVTEAPVSEGYDTVVICPGSAFVYMGVDYGGPAVVDTMLATVYGCDSLVHVSLVLRDSSYALHALHSLDHRQWADTVPIALCANETLYVVDSTEGSTAWQWSVSSSEFGVQSSEFSASATMTPTSGLQTPSSHTVTLVATDPGGCTDTLQWPLIVFPTPTAEFIWTPENPVDISPDVQLMNYSQPDSCSGWLWLVPDAPGSADCDSLTAFEPIYSWQGDDVLGTYDVRLVAYLTTTYDTVTNTCSDTAQHTIEVVTAWLDFPNLVTPNGDGVNDRWVVVNLLELGQYPMNELWIYNVWGNCIYHVRNISQGDQFWDPNETASPDGTYYYRFTARNRHGIVKRNGVIEVLR